jgi:hypothetical protein
MKKKETKDIDKPEGGQDEARIRLPGFINDDEIGLGDVIKRATHAFGIKPCGGCERRAATLNRWFSFSGKRSK